MEVARVTHVRWNWTLHRFYDWNNHANIGLLSYHQCQLPFKADYEDAKWLLQYSFCTHIPPCAPKRIRKVSFSASPQDALCIFLWIFFRRLAQGNSQKKILAHTVIDADNIFFICVAEKIFKTWYCYSVPRGSSFGCELLSTVVACKARNTPDEDLTSTFGKIHTWSSPWKRFLWSQSSLPYLSLDVYCRSSGVE